MPRPSCPTASLCQPSCGTASDCPEVRRLLPLLRPTSVAVNDELLARQMALRAAMVKVFVKLAEDGLRGS
jgi:hypothetical protein